MPRGLPDYYNPDTVVSQRLANVEEIVTHQRGIASIDNRGRTLFHEHFHENMSGWVQTAAGDASAGVIDTSLSIVPPSSAYFDAGTVGGSGAVLAEKYFQLGLSKRLGIEVSYWYSENAPEFRLVLRYGFEGSQYLCQTQILNTSSSVKIWTGGAWVTVADVGYTALAAGTWLPIKLVADFASGDYTRLLVGQVQVDLSAYPMNSSVLGVDGRADYRLWFGPVAAGDNDAYIGHVTGTVDEP